MLNDEDGNPSESGALRDKKKRVDFKYEQEAFLVVMLSRKMENGLGEQPPLSTTQAAR